MKSEVGSFKEGPTCARKDFGFKLQTSYFNLQLLTFDFNPA